MAKVTAVPLAALSEEAYDPLPFSLIGAPQVVGQSGAPAGSSGPHHPYESLSIPKHHAALERRVNSAASAHWFEVDSQSPLGGSPYLLALINC